MEYARLGNTGLKVSRICLGCMGFGDAGHWIHKWVLNEESSRPIIQKALELGINFFDTANVYSLGVSEEILGRALKDFARREEVVIATKVHGKMREDPNGGGLSRKAILTEIDNSLRRLGTDYVDLYQIHRWDYETPIEETLEALNDVVRAGKARYMALRPCGLAVPEGAACGRKTRLDALRLNAKSLQPDLPRRRARDAAAPPRRGDWFNSLQPAGLGTLDARLG